MTPYHDYHVGQQVVCVNDDVPTGQIPLEVREGEIYTIRSVGMYASYLAGSYLGVRLAGIERGQCPFTNDQDPPYRADRFRPLVRDPLAALRQAAADPRGPIQGDFDEPRRKVPVKEEEKV